MANFNKVMLIGNLTRDPELRYTPKGNPVADITIAVNRQYTLESGERREEATFVDVTLWGRQAEITNEYLRKGRPVFIEGRLQLDTWEDKQTGQKRSKLSVVSENMQFLGPRPEGVGGGSGGSRREDDQGAPRRSAPAARDQGAGSAAKDPGLDPDDDIPF